MSYECNNYFNYQYSCFCRRNFSWILWKWLFKSSKNDQITTIKHVLLYLVAQAEKELSNGTGDLKLAKVYNEFVAEYPDLAKVITYEQFKVIVDDVLDNFKNLLNNNDIASYIKGDEK